MTDSSKLKKNGILALFAVMASVGVLWAGIAFGMFNTPTAHADDSSATSITVSPARQPMDVNPGVNYKGTMKVINTGTAAFDFDVSVSPYGIANENYDPTFETRDDDFSQIADWVTFEDYDHSLQPGKECIVNYELRVPATAQGGGQYAVLFAETIPSASSGQTGVTVGKRVGSLLFAKISGASTLSGDIVEQNVNWWYQDMPAPTFMRIHNSGNVDSEATYSLKVDGIFGGHFDFTSTGDSGKKLIIPHTTRRIQLDWNKAGTWYGFYHVSQTVQFADASGNIDMWVLYCPLWLLLVIILTIVLIIVLIVLNVLKKKKAKNARTAANGVEVANGSTVNPLVDGQGIPNPAQYPVAGAQYAQPAPGLQPGGVMPDQAQMYPQQAVPEQPVADFTSQPVAPQMSQADYEEYLRFKQWQESQGGGSQS